MTARQHEDTAMSKRPSLFSVKPSEAPADSTEETKVNGQTETRTKRAPSRVGKRVLSIYLDPLAWKQLRLLALENNTSTQALGEEAINLLFANYRINRSA
jgi:hypothetical protein